MTLPDDDARDRTLDHVARALHAEALAHVSPRTRMQLRARRAQAQRAPTRGTRILGWGLAGACAAVFAIAIGWRMGLPPPAAGPMPSAVAQSGSSDYREAYATLDEDPDFYLWLATTDVQPLAME